MNPKELFKKLHPDKFSDSEIKENISCSRTLLDFSLSTLSEQNKHFDFENFVKKLLEREVCPNLIEETGPASGGDGKVDTETYPVASQLQDFWLNGINKENERWAFAVSLKSDWKTKCNLDIEKIINTQRGYKKIFFITNQAIKNNIRLAYQDEKNKETGLEITIFDKTWILDKALKIENIDLLKILGIDNIQKEKILGKNDYRRYQRIKEIENKLREYADKGKVNQDVVDLAIESAMLSIDMEESEDIINTKFQRALRFAKKKGNYTAEKTILYEICWYSHWRIDNKAQFEEYYMKYEEAVKKDKDIEEIGRLFNLWLLEFGRNDCTQEVMENKTETLRDLFMEKLDSKSRVTYLKASSYLCFIKITLQEDVDEQFTKMIEIINEVKKFKEYDFITLAKMFEILLPIYEDNSLYNELYELITMNLTTRKGEIQKAEMYLNKAKILSQKEKYYEAINFFGRCLNLLYKWETTGKLTEVYVNIGANYEMIGLKYAAKNYYIAAIAMFIDEFFKENYLEPFSLNVLKRLIDIEISQGNVENAINWFEIRNILMTILLEKDEKINTESEQEYLMQRDSLIAIEILKTSKSDFNKTMEIINKCLKNGLTISEIMAKYVIGIYDEEVLAECNNIEKMDDLVNEFYESACDQNLPFPQYINGNQICLESFLLGNKIKINIKNSKLSNRFAEYILALLENTFATMYCYKTFMRGDIIINLNEVSSGTFNFDYEFDGIDTYNVNIFGCYLDNISIDIQRIINNKLYELLLNILAVNFIYDNFDETIKKIYENDRIFERGINHTNNIYNLNNIFGVENDKEIEYYEIFREKEWYSSKKLNENINKEQVINLFDGKTNVIYGNPPDKLLFENVPQNNIYSSGMIKCSHWDVAKWQGIIYVTDNVCNRFAQIGFLFGNVEGAKLVFQDLIDYASRNDNDGKIVISFIKGINKEREFDYRIMITSKMEIPKNSTIITLATRFHNMECESNTNLKRLETLLTNNSNAKLSILPVVELEKGNFEPLFDYEINISKVNIKEAYCIGKFDIESVVIMKEDNPIIPTNVSNPPIKELLELKREQK